MDVLHELDAYAKATRSRLDMRCDEGQWIITERVCIDNGENPWWGSGESFSAPSLEECYRQILDRRARTLADDAQYHADSSAAIAIQQAKLRLLTDRL